MYSVADKFDRSQIRKPPAMNLNVLLQWCFSDLDIGQLPLKKF